MKKLPATPVDRKKQVTHWLVAICTIVIIIWSFTGLKLGGLKATAGQ
ncbi:phosphonate ABC transporter, permease protein PhnE, partial [Bacillus thuringiensis]|nr:phosphonate ABC transporter, permease protein PhnE [Bacillus thuringiensis]